MGELLFRWRGALLAPAVLAVLWVARPTLLTLMLGLLLTLTGEGLRLWALGVAGEPTRAQVLEAPRLITEGPYGLVRNPLYLGNALNAVGLAVAGAGGVGWAGSAGLLLGVLAVLAGVYGPIVRAEEAFLEERFGENFRDYAARVPRWLPRPRAAPGSSGFDVGRLRFERSTLGWLALVWAVLAGKLWL